MNDMGHTSNIARDSVGRPVWVGQTLVPGVVSPAAADTITTATLPLRMHAVRLGRVPEDRRQLREWAQHQATIAHLRNRFDHPPRAPGFDLTVIRVGGQPLVRSSLILCMRGVVAGVCEWLEISQSDPMLERRVRQRRADVPGTMSVEIVIEALR